MKNMKPRSQLEKRIDGSALEYVGGKGIEVSGSVINLKPARSGWYGEKDEILGGVWSDNYGVKIEEDGRIHLISPTQGALGGIFPPSYGLYEIDGVLKADLGKGMMFYTPKDAPTGHANFVISPRLGDGLRMEPEEEDNEEIPTPGTGREKSEAAIQINAGKGLEFGEREYFQYRYGALEKTGFTSELRVKLGKNLSFGENGEINASGGGAEYKAGENIEISADGTISATVKEYTAGKNITISADGEISATGSGAELTAGGGITIETDEETGTQTIAAAAGEGVEIRDGKICTVPNIQNAVLITEADAKYLLHNFSQVEYIAGNRIGYAGPGNQIVLQKTICYKLGGIAPNGKVIVNSSSNKDPSELPDIPMYAFMEFDPAIQYSSKFYVGIKVNFVRATNVYTVFQIVGVEEDQKETSFASINVYDTNGVQVALLWSEINAPSDPYPYGYAKARIVYRYLGAGGMYMLYTITNMDFTVPFSSLAEYQAAVGLTYEPITLTEVVDNPTVVRGKEVT